LSRTGNGDHYGGLRTELAGRIPIRHFYDNSPNKQPAQAVVRFLQQTYPCLYAKATHTVRKASGDNESRIGRPRLADRDRGRRGATRRLLAGAGKPNPYCCDVQAEP